MYDAAYKDMVEVHGQKAKCENPERRAMNAGVSSTGVMDVDHHMEGVLPALPSSSSNAVGLPPQLEVE